MPAARRDALVPRLAKVALDFHATLNEPARLEDFARLALPMLIVQGGRTAAPTQRICERLAATVPGAKLEIVDGAGHMAPMTHRDAVNDLIVAHLDANAALTRRTSCKTCKEAIVTQSA
jgi:pimeloyl-ACP methyl ester carboxylesterase